MLCQLAVDEEAQVDDFTAAGATFRLRQPGSQLWLTQKFHGLDIQQIQLLTFHPDRENTASRKPRRELKPGDGGGK